jgi:hypothetical protein
VANIERSGPERRTGHLRIPGDLAYKKIFGAQNLSGAAGCRHRGGDGAGRAHAVLARLRESLASWRLAGSAVRLEDALVQGDYREDATFAALRGRSAALPAPVITWRFRRACSQP